MFRDEQTEHLIHSWHNEPALLDSVNALAYCNADVRKTAPLIRIKPNVCVCVLVCTFSDFSAIC